MRTLDLSFSDNQTVFPEDASLSGGVDLSDRALVNATSLVRLGRIDEDESLQILSKDTIVLALSFHEVFLEVFTTLIIQIFPRTSPFFIYWLTQFLFLSNSIHLTLSNA